MQVKRSDANAQPHSAMVYWKAEAARRKQDIAAKAAELNKRARLLEPIAKAFSTDAEKALAAIGAVPLAAQFQLCAGQSAAEFGEWIESVRATLR